MVVGGGGGGREGGRGGGEDTHAGGGGGGEEGRVACVIWRLRTLLLSALASQPSASGLHLLA